LVGLLPTRDRSYPQKARKKERKPVLAAFIILVSVALTPAPLEALQAGSENRHESAPQPLVFNEEYPINTRVEGARLEGSGGSQNIYFSVPVTKIISSATLKLHYTAPKLRPNEARLELTLNGSSAGHVMLTPGADLETTVSLPTDLLTNDNTLSLQLVGSC